MFSVRVADAPRPHLEMHLPLLTSPVDEKQADGLHVVRHPHDDSRIRVSEVFREEAQILNNPLTLGEMSYTKPCVKMKNIVLVAMFGLMANSHGQVLVLDNFSLQSQIVQPSNPTQMQSLTVDSQNATRTLLASGSGTATAIQSTGSGALNVAFLPASGSGIAQVTYGGFVLDLTTNPIFVMNLVASTGSITFGLLVFSANAVGPIGNVAQIPATAMSTPFSIDLRSLPGATSSFLSGVNRFEMAFETSETSPVIFETSQLSLVPEVSPVNLLMIAFIAWLTLRRASRQAHG